MAKDAAMQEYAQAMLSSLARSLSVPYEMLAVDLERCLTSADLHDRAERLRAAAEGEEGLRLLRDVMLRRIQLPVLDELRRDAYGLGRGQWA